MRKPRAMGSHQSSKPQTVSWATPPHVIQALGGWESFDLDPCAIPGSPIRTAVRGICLPDDGMAAEWAGRVWLNPPYTHGEVERWLRRLADHGTGTGLIFARTETEAFRTQVWERASGLLFLFGRLHFHYPDGRSSSNSGAPSVLVAYGQEDLDRLAEADIPGHLTPLRFARWVLVARPETWRQAVAQAVWSHRGPVALADLYRALASHPNARRNRHWRAKVRQTLQQGPFRAVRRGEWESAG